MQTGLPNKIPFNRLLRDETPCANVRGIPPFEKCEEPALSAVEGVGQPQLE